MHQITNLLNFQAGILMHEIFKLNCRTMSSESLKITQMIANKMIYFYAFIQICILIHRRTFVLTITSHSVSILWNWDSDKALAVLCSRCANEISIRFNCKEMHSQTAKRSEPMRQSCDKQIISFYLLCVVLEKKKTNEIDIFSDFRRRLHPKRVNLFVFLHYLLIKAILLHYIICIKRF